MENCKKYNKYFYLSPKNYVNYKMKKYEPYFKCLEIQNMKDNHGFT